MPQQRPFNYELTGFYHILLSPWWSPELLCTSLYRQLTHCGPTTWYYDEDGQTHSGDEQTGSSLAADDTLDWSTEQESSPLMQPMTPKPMKVVAVSATSGPVIEPPHLSHSRTCFQTCIEQWRVDSPLRSCQLVWQKINYSNLSTMALTVSSQCPKCDVPCSIEAQHIWLADHITQTFNMALVSQCSEL